MPVGYRDHAAKLSRRWAFAGASLLVITPLLAVFLLIGLVAGAGGGPAFAPVLAIVSLQGVGPQLPPGCCASGEGASAFMALRPTP